jgi:hypothetical protein
VTVALTLWKADTGSKMIKTSRILTASYDYELRFFNEKGDMVKSMSYQKMISALGIGNEIVHGAPLSQGGTPQVATISNMICKQMKLSRVEVFFNGSQIL